MAIIPCKSCYYAQIMLIHNWENTSNLKRDKHPSHWCLSLPALHPHCGHRWPECHCPHAGHCLTCFSELSQLILPNYFLLPCDDLHMHPAIIPAQCSNAFGLQLYYAQHSRLKPTPPSPQLQPNKISHETLQCTYLWFITGCLSCFLVSISSCSWGDQSLVQTTFLFLQCRFLLWRIKWLKSKETSLHILSPISFIIM